MNNKSVWINGEVLAQQYLIKQGYKIIGTNVKLANIEVDIVAVCPKKVLLKELKNEYKNGAIIKSSYLAGIKNTFDTLVFVEVKTRANDSYGLPQEAVNTIKQNKIRKFAQMFTNNNKYSNMPVRYDIIAILGEDLTHIKNAF